MIYVVFLIILLLVGNYRFYYHGFNTNYLNKEQTEIIKGIFIALVFCGHFGDYVKFTSPLDYPFIRLYRYIGQFVVAMFLLYSGYGIMLSILNKGENYVRKIPLRRILRTLIHFDIAVCIYLVIYMEMYRIPSFVELISAFLGWNGFGNSNWYIFDILILWGITYIVFESDIIQDTKIKLGFCTIFMILFGFIIEHYKPMWWYDTLICFPLGMWIAMYKENIPKWLFQDGKICLKYWGGIVLLTCIVVILGENKNNFCLYECWMIAFSLLVFGITMKIEFQSRILSWLGKNLFEIYILMRIPMIIFQNHMIGHNYYFFALCMICTYILVILFQRILKFIDQYLPI